MKHKPWEDKPENVWGGPDATKDEIIAIWKSFCDSLAVVPDSLRLSIARYKAFVMHNSGELPDGDDWDGDDFDNDAFQDEWQQLADSNQFIGDDDYMLDSTVHVPWNPHYRHDVSPVQDYSTENGNEPTMVEVNDSYEPERRLTEPLDAHIVMNARQKLAVDMVLDLTNQDANDDDARKQGILIGIGGTGKSTCIHDIQHKVEAQHGLGSVVKLAPTGKAASVIGGYTLHSKQRGLSLVVGRQKYSKISGRKLKDLQTRYKDTKLVLIDEFSMIKQKEILHINLRLKEIMGNDLAFGGLAVVLIGDPGQLPPVLGDAVWTPKPKTQDGKDGLLLYKEFHQNVMELTEVKRVEDNADAAEFLDILLAVYSGNASKEQFIKVRDTCCQDGMGEPVWGRPRCDLSIHYQFRGHELQPRALETIGC